ncbi:hypothetical protein V5H98_02975 [Georgenia sp. M64]|uniref:hypothetical protein n=1 Tax=Georgenia sp. M64 TaxID=3120520 RepID=UPI0030DF68A6
MSTADQPDQTAQRDQPDQQDQAAQQDPAEPAVRATRALRTTLLATAGASVALGVLGLLVAVLTSGSSTMWPGVSLFAVGQLVALTAAALTWRGLRRVVAGAAPRTVTTAVRSWLGRLAVAELVLLAVVAGAWLLLRPEAVVAVVACVLVSAQLAALLHVLRR